MSTNTVMLRNGLRAVQKGLFAFGRLMKAAGRVTRDVTRASHNLVGEYTLPMEQEWFGTTPPSFKNLKNYLGIAVLTFPVPLTILTIFASVTIVPLVGNSIQYIPKAFVNTANIALFDTPDDKIPEPTMGLQSTWLRVFYAIPGILLGGAFGLGTAAFIAGGRVLSNSWRSGTRAYVKTMHLADDDPKTLDLEDERHWFRKYVMGLPGILLGDYFGLGTAALIANWKMGIRLFDTIINLVLPKTNHAPRSEWINTKREWARYIVGSPGLLLSLPIGIGVAGLIAIGRVITNSCKTGYEIFMSALDFSFEKDIPTETTEENSSEEKNSKKSKRHWFKKYVMGFPGFVIGGLCGLGVSGFVINWKTASRFFITLANLTLHSDDHLKGKDVKRDARHWSIKYVLGMPGLLVGSLAGIVAMMAISIGRIPTNSWKTAKSVFISALNLSVDPDKDSFGKGLAGDERHWFRKYIIGFPGLVLGGIAGLFSAFALINCKTAVRAFVSAVNLSSDEKSLISSLGLKKDKRHWFGKYVLGLPSLLLGGGLGLSVAAVIINWKMGVRLFISTINLVLEPTLAHSAWKNTKKEWVRYFLGIPGLLLGLGLGVIAGSFIAAGRIITNSWKTGVEFYNSAINLSLEKETPASSEVQRHWFKRLILGFPGLVFGGALGLSIAELITNWKTGARVFVSLVNSVLHKNNQMKATDLHQDKRHWSARYFWGLPGLFIGSVLGIGAMVTIAIGRVITNSWKTACSMFFSILNPTLKINSTNRGKNLSDDERHWFKKYVMGLPGLLLGVMAGLTAAATVINWKSGAHLFITLLNKALPHDREVPATDMQKDERRWFSKYILGFPGLCLGALFGACAALLVTAGRVLNQTFCSWRALSGSLMNGAFERSWFAGLGGDNRSWQKKTVGGVGYVLALAITWPIASVVFVTRKIPELVGTLFGIISSPFVFTGKVLGKSVKHFVAKPRFSVTQEEKDSELLQRFKNLYKCLNAMGEFKENYLIPADGNGEKSVWSFLRKCITLNVKSVTEETLDSILEQYKSSEGLTKDRKEFQQLLDQIKQQYRSCFTSSREYDEISKEIDEVGKFIFNYLYQTHQYELTPAIYSGIGSSWSSTFWGRPSSREAEDNFVPDVAPSIA